MATPQFTCANWSADSTGCNKFGNYTCKGCRLVVYCGSDCQKSHWKLHKIDCKSPLGKDSWVPRWALEDRRPDFNLNNDKRGWLSTFSGNKCLWGNIPAIDVLQLGSNEGNDYGKQLNLLFAASGDLRNVVKTIAQIPSGYKKPIDVTMNDWDFDVVARNAIILLIALVVDNVDEAIDCILHIWYSALIRKSDLDILQQKILPLIERFCEEIKNVESDALIQKTWSFGQRSLMISLPKSSWNGLSAYMKVPQGLMADRASRIRTAVTLDESRKDYLDRHLLFQSPSRRIAKHRFRQDGLLLPFGSPRHEFQVPNPTLFQAGTWPMADCADPLEGWSLKDVEDCSSGPASADIYGKLSSHIRAVLRAFFVRLFNLPVTFQLYCLDIQDLRRYLRPDTFSRIEVSNMSDECFLGIHKTSFLMGSLLQEPLVNPHATLITLFRNAIRDFATQTEGILTVLSFGPTDKLVLDYGSLRRVPAGNYRRWVDPKFITTLYAKQNVANYDNIFDRFMKAVRPSALRRLCGVAIKEEHTVIEKWPFRLKLRCDEPGAMEEFDRLVDEVVWAKERYVEWRRA